MHGTELATAIFGELLKKTPLRSNEAETIRRRITSCPTNTDDERVIEYVFHSILPDFRSSIDQAFRHVTATEHMPDQAVRRFSRVTRRMVECAFAHDASLGPDRTVARVRLKTAIPLSRQHVPHDECFDLETLGQHLFPSDEHARQILVSFPWHYYARTTDSVLV